MAFVPGFNVHAQGTGVKSFIRLDQWVKEAKPSLMLVMDNPGYAQKLKALGVPIVVHRIWTKDSWYEQPVSNWFDAHQHLGEVYQALENERGFALDYTLRFIQHNNALAKPHRVCLWNISSGTPEPTEWNDPKLLDILRLMAKTPGRYAVGVHEYFHNNPMGLIPPPYWPSQWEVDASHYNSHIMRIGRLALVCQKHGIAVPDVFVTEAGTDNHGDLEPTLGKTGRGWKEAQALWKQLYPTLSPAEAFYMGLWYVARVMYANLPFVKGMAVFCYGHIVNEWNDFDCEDLTDLLTLLKGWQVPPLLAHLANTTSPSPTTFYPYRVEFVSSGYTSVNIRTSATTSAAKLTTPATRGLAVFSDGKVNNGWYGVRLPETGERGFVSAQYVKLQPLPLTMKG